ncbi:MAG: M67 family metallopeptidase [Acidobacteria bacterium]|nr:M67 family metallopeptidase [Acidobacteriota bacterium]
MKEYIEAVLPEIAEHSRLTYPEECCGVLTGPTEGKAAWKVHRCRNIQNELHVQDPHQHPRTARTAFFLHPLDLLAVYRAAERSQCEIKGFYHSHVEAGAYFSSEDERNAAPSGMPSYPDAIHVVVSVMGGKPSAYGVFRWDPEARRHVQML